MFEALKPLPEDKILALMQKFREDPRETKIDLGVGVYKNASGVTPVMRAVKAAEKRIWEEETTKSYTGLAGEPAFLDAMISLVLGDAVARDTVAAVQLTALNFNPPTNTRTTPAVGGRVGRQYFNK